MALDHNGTKMLADSGLWDLRDPSSPELSTLSVGDPSGFALSPDGTKAILYVTANAVQLWNS